MWTRRQFLKRIGGLGLGGLAAAVLGKLGWHRWKMASVRPARRRRPGGVLTEHEFVTLETLADLIVPADEHGPGARDLDAATRIEGRLKRDVAMLQRYRQGLLWLDQAAAEMYGPGTYFIDLDRPRQQRLLEHIDAALKEWQRPAGGLLGRAWRYWDRLMTTLFGFGAGVLFFDLVRDDVFEAVYSHPRMWQALAYDGPPQPRGYWNGARGDWNIIDDCPPTQRGR